MLVNNREMKQFNLYSAETVDYYCKLCRMNEMDGEFNLPAVW